MMNIMIIIILQAIHMSHRLLHTLDKKIYTLYKASQKKPLMIFRKDWMILSKTVFVFEKQHSKLYTKKVIQVCQLTQNYLQQSERCKKHVFWYNFRRKNQTILSKNSKSQKLKAEMSDQLLKGFFGTLCISFYLMVLM